MIGRRTTGRTHSTFRQRALDALSDAWPLVVGAAAALAFLVGSFVLAPREQEDRTGEIVAVGNPSGAGDRAFVLARVGGKVVRLEGAEMAHCRIGDLIDVRQTYIVRRSSSWLQDTTATGRRTTPLP